jgi:hypothetical protein
MNNYLAALFLGLSFGNLWICVLLVFSLQSTNRSTCGGYLVGRVVAILALAVVTALVGSVVTVRTSTLNLLSGAMLSGFGLYLAATRLGGWVPPWRRTVQARSMPACDGECESCPSRGHAAYQSACEACDDHGVCSAEEPEVEPLTRLARRTRGRPVPESGRGGFLFGATMGGLRGVAMCGKLLVLAPMLLQASVPEALGIGLVFAVSSSLYPLLGFLCGKVAVRFVRYKRAIFAASCLVLIVVGGFYVSRGLGDGERRLGKGGVSMGGWPQAPRQGINRR